MFDTITATTTISMTTLLEALDTYHQDGAL